MGSLLSRAIGVLPRWMNGNTDASSSRADFSSQLPRTGRARGPESDRHRGDRRAQRSARARPEIQGLRHRSAVRRDLASQVRDRAGDAERSSDGSRRQAEPLDGALEKGLSRCVELNGGVEIPISERRIAGHASQARVRARLRHPLSDDCAGLAHWGGGLRLREAPERGPADLPDVDVQVDPIQ